MIPKQNWTEDPANAAEEEPRDLRADTTMHTLVMIQGRLTDLEATSTSLYRQRFEKPFKRDFAITPLMETCDGTCSPNVFCTDRGSGHQEFAQVPWSPFPDEQQVCCLSSIPTQQRLSSWTSFSDEQQLCCLSPIPKQNESQVTVQIKQKHHGTLHK